MRITYRQLSQLLTYLTEEQLDCDVMAEMPSEWGTECYHAGLRIAGPNNDNLDDGHPTIFVRGKHEERTTKTIPEIAKDIGLVE